MVTNITINYTHFINIYIYIYIELKINNKLAKTFFMFGETMKMMMILLLSFVVLLRFLVLGKECKKSSLCF